MAIAPGSNDLYADRESEIVQYSSSGSRIGNFGAGEISESHGLAVNAGATKIYVGTPSKVKVFGASAIVPDAVTEAATSISKVSVTLNGSIGADGGPGATCLFQYATSRQYFEHGFEGASEAPCSPAGPFTGTSMSAVSATITGLSSEREYRFRILASNTNGSSNGEAFSFTTPGAVNLATGAATAITATTATLSGTVNPEGTLLDACRFEYGTDHTYGNAVPCGETPTEIGSGNADVPVHADLTGLRGGSEYRFRLVAYNEFGSARGRSVIQNFRVQPLTKCLWPGLDLTAPRSLA